MPNIYRQSRTWAKQVGVRRALDLVTRKEPWRSEWLAYGFTRDLLVPFEAPMAKVSLRVVPMDAQTAAQMFNLDEPGLEPDDYELRKSRGELFDAGIGVGYVALTEDDSPAYCQWLIGPADNHRIGSFFDGAFPQLQPGEALLEGAYTPIAHRGKGVMPAAMARIAVLGQDIGARRVMTFVTTDNVPSIKGCERAGFAIDTLRTVTTNGFRRSVQFAPHAHNSE